MYLLIKQSLLVISTDIRSLFEEYLHPPCRRFGIMKPLTLHESPACLKEPRCVFVPRPWFKSAVNLAIEEQVNQALETLLIPKQSIRHGLMAHLPNFGACQFWKLELLSRLLFS